MQHRRAASDTAMFRRVVTADSVKEGSSSNHSSRSATPLVTSLLRPAGVHIKFTVLSQILFLVMFS